MIGDPNAALFAHLQQMQAEGKSVDLWLLEQYQSVEFQVQKRVKEQLSPAYMRLTNSMIAELNPAEAEQALKEMQLAAHDLATYIQGQLNKMSILKTDVRDLSAQHGKDPDFVFQNLIQFCNRFSFTPPPEPKDGKPTRGDDRARELTALYYLAKDFAAMMDAVPLERYYRCNGGEENDEIAVFD
jgi:hypothetical protein